MLLDLCIFLAVSYVFSLSVFAALLGQLKDIVLYTMDSIPLFQEYVIFQWQSHSAPKPERLVNFVSVFRNVIFMALIYDTIMHS